MKMPLSSFALLVAFSATAIIGGCGPLQGATPNANSLAASVGALPVELQPINIKHGTLLFVATGDNVYLLSYPSGKLVSSLEIPGYNICSDNDGNVFVPTTGYQIAEYSHYGELIQKLQDGDVPLGCAVDPTTGNLAVTNEGSGAGEVAIYSNAKGQA